MFKRIIITIAIILGSFLMLDGANALTLYPSRLETSLAPGQAKTYEISLFNETKEDLYLNAILSPFDSKSEDGKPILGSSKEATFLNWIKLPISSILLRPGETRKVPLNISVPLGVKSGGHYFASIWEIGSGPNKPVSQVGIISRVGTLVLLRVNGKDIKESLEIKDFIKSKKNIFYIFGPIGFYVRLANNGNVHLKPQGTLLIKDFSGKVVDNKKFNSEALNILPGTTRKMESVWQPQNIFLVGKFSARLDLKYGEAQNEISTKEVSFWILPWWFILILVLVVCAIVFLIIKKLKRLKGAKKI
ncbi:MAG: hypothetical protein WCV92_00540 [Candidatus Buchananbacteria bacterium]